MGFFVGTQSEIELRSQFGIGNWARELVQINDKAKLFDWLSQKGATRFETFGVYDFWAEEGMGDSRQFKWLFEYMLSRPLTEVKGKYWPYLNDDELNDIKYWAMAQRIKPITHKVAFIDCLYQLEMTATDIEELGDALQRREPCPQFDADHRKWLKDYYDALKLVGDRGIGEYVNRAKKLGEAHGKAAFRECLSKLLPMTNHDKDNTNDAKIIRLLADFSDTKQKWFEEYVEEYETQQISNHDKPDSRANRQVAKLPPELDNPTVEIYFKKAIEFGLIAVEGGKYKWLKTKRLLACFACIICIKTGLNTGVITRNNEEIRRIAWKPFEILFGVTNLRIAYNDICKIFDVNNIDAKILNKLINYLPNIRDGKSLVEVFK